MNKLLKLTNYSDSEYKEKIIDFLLMSGGRFWFYDEYFPWKYENQEELIIELHLESPDSTEISCKSVKNRNTKVLRPRERLINIIGWDNFTFYEKLYEHCLKENKKIYEIGCWNV